MDTNTNSLIKQKPLPVLTSYSAKNALQDFNSRHSTETTTWFPLQPVQSSATQHSYTQPIPSNRKPNHYYDYSSTTLSDNSDEIPLPQYTGSRSRVPYPNVNEYTTPIKSNTKQMGFKNASLTQLMKKTNTYYSDYSFNYNDIHYSSDSDTESDHDLPNIHSNSTSHGLSTHRRKPNKSKPIDIRQYTEDLDDSGEVYSEPQSNTNQRSIPTEIPESGNGDKSKIVQELVDQFNECVKNSNNIRTLLSQLTSDLPEPLSSLELPQKSN